MPAQQRRTQLLDAALQIIARDGYGAVSIEAIARECDVTRPVIYNVFDDLDDLLSTLLDRQERRALDQLLRTMTVPPDLADLRGYLARMVEDLVAIVVDDPLTWRPIFLTFAGTPLVVQRRIERAREMVRERIAQTIRLLLNLASPAARGLDPDVLSHMVVAIGEYFGRLILEDANAVDAGKLAETIGALLPLD